MTESQIIQADEIRSEPTVSLEHLVKVLRRQGWIIVVCAILAAAAAYAYSRSQPKKYTATASLVFNNNQSLAAQAAGQAATANTDPQGQRETNLELVELSKDASQQTAARIGHGVTPQQITSDVSAAAQGNSNVVSISATSARPALAAQIANTFARNFIQQQKRTQQIQIQAGINLVEQQYTAIPQSERGTSQAQSLQDHIESLKILQSLQNSTQLVQPASTPKSPSSPRPTRDAVFGLVIGLIVGLVFALARARRDRRLREPSDIAETMRVPMLGLIPHANQQSGQASGAMPELEPFRMLRAHLRYFNVDRELQILMVVSAQPAEGKTTISRNLATAAATTGGRTLLLEADLRRPTVGERFGLPPADGLTEALVGATTFDEAVQRLEVTHGLKDGEVVHSLDVITAGSIPPNPAELLESHAMTRLLAWARDRYGLVVIDTAPLSVVADSIPLMSEVDGVIVVSRLGLTTRDVIGRLRDQLEQLDAPVLGVVVNDAPGSRGSRGYYQYGYSGNVSGGYTEAANAPMVRPASKRQIDDAHPPVLAPDQASALIAAQAIPAAPPTNGASPDLQTQFKVKTRRIESEAASESDRRSPREETASSDDGRRRDMAVVPETSDVPAKGLVSRRLAGLFTRGRSR